MTGRHKKGVPIVRPRLAPPPPPPHVDPATTDRLICVHCGGELFERESLYLHEYGAVACVGGLTEATPVLLVERVTIVPHTT